MPKRKYVSINDYDKLCKKLELIEKEVQRKKQCRRRSRRLSSSSSDEESQRSSCARRSHSDDHPPSNASSADDIHERSPSPAPSAAAAAETEPSVSAGLVPVAPAPEPAPSAPTPDEAPAPGTSSRIPGVEVTLNTLDDADLELDADTLEILGIDPTKTEKFGKIIQKDVAVRFEHTATVGLSTEDRKTLMTRYLVPDNCKLIGAPALNAELKAALSEAVIKRDATIESKQKLMASAISSLGEAISLLISSKEKNTDLLRLLMDTAKTLCDCQHHETKVRRNFIVFSVKKDMKDSLQNTKIDSFLFGQDLPETLKTAKAISKQGAELKLPSTSKPSASRANLPTTSKNWKSQGRVNQTRPQGTTSKSSSSKPTMAPTANKEPRANSYKRSQPARASHYRR